MFLFDSHLEQIMNSLPQTFGEAINGGWNKSRDWEQMQKVVIRMLIDIKSKKVIILSLLTFYHQVALCLT